MYILLAAPVAPSPCTVTHKTTARIAGHACSVAVPGGHACIGDQTARSLLAVWQQLNARPEAKGRSCLLAVDREGDHFGELFFHGGARRHVHGLADVERNSLFCHAPVWRRHQLYQRVQRNLQPRHVLRTCPGISQSLCRGRCGAIQASRE